MYKCPKLHEIVKLTNELDALAPKIHTGNKTAIRLARKTLSEIKKQITPCREELQGVANSVPKKTVTKKKKEP